MNLTIFGCGYSGKAIARKAIELAGSDKSETVAGTTRSAEKGGHLQAAGIAAHLYVGGEPDAALAGRLANTTHLVQSIAPGADGDPLLALGAARLQSLMPKLQWVGYLSTVGVYGDHHGAWVDEETPCRPVSRRSVERVEAENGWADFAVRTDVPVAILRLAGIYGPGRNAFVNLTEGNAKRIVKPDQVFNRIRVEDIASATRFLAEGRLGGLFNVTDDEPAPPQDVVAFAAQLMNVAPPPETPFETANLTPMARSFYGENKRVSNARIRAAGFDFAHPDYRSSLASLWKCGNWRA